MPLVTFNVGLEPNKVFISLVYVCFMGKITLKASFALVLCLLYHLSVFNKLENFCLNKSHIS